MHKTLLSIALSAALAGPWSGSIAQAGPAPSSDASDSAATLQRQLAAQTAINEQLRRRVSELERQLADNGRSAGTTALDPSAAKAPPPASETANTAIEEALVSKGLALLPPGALRLTPSLAWDHSGSGDAALDRYAATLGIEVGLPWDLAARVSVPYVWAHDASLGSNRGIGDAGIGLSRTLVRETATLPALVAHLDYTHDNGADPFAQVALGSGYRAWRAELAASKRFSPVVVYGNVSYRHPLARIVETDDFAGRVAPGRRLGIGAGISLAATPGIALDAGVSFQFVDPSRYEPWGAPAYRDSRQTVGYVTLGASFLLARNLALMVNVAPGITRDAPDLVVSVSLPYRF